MKKSIIVFTYCLLFVFTLINSASAKVNNCDLITKEVITTNPLNSIILPQGTSVSLKLIEAISSEDVEIGNTVYLQVYRNVVVRNTVVISAGSFVEGRITKVKKAYNNCGECESSLNQCSMLEIVVETVQAIDGSTVNLNGMPHRLKGQCNGQGSTVVEIGAKLSARVLDNVIVYP